MTRRGSAILIVLGILAVLAAVAVTALAFLRQEVSAGTFARDRDAAVRAARAGIRHAVAAARVYAADRAVSDPADPIWAAGVAGSLGATYDGGADSYAARIFDAASRVYINGGATAEGHRLLANLAEIASGGDPAKGTQAADALAGKAWRTEDEVKAALAGILDGDPAANFLSWVSFAAWEDPKALKFADEAAYRDLATTIVDPAARPLHPLPTDFSSVADLRAGILPGRAAPADLRGDSPYAPRAPVNVNLAPREVLQALLMNLRACVFYRGIGDASTASLQAGFDDFPEVTTPVSRDLAKGIADEIVFQRAAAPFRDFPDFETFLAGLVAKPGLGLSAIDAEVILAALDPEPYLAKWNPDAPLARAVDKSDVISGTTEICFGPPGVFGIEAAGTVRSASGEALAAAALREYVRAHETLRLSAQRDLKTGASFDKTASFPEAGAESDPSKGSVVSGAVGLAAQEVAGATRYATNADDVAAGGASPSGASADGNSVPAGAGPGASLGEPKKLPHTAGGGPQTILEGRGPSEGTDGLRDGLLLVDAVLGNGASGPHLGTFASYPDLPATATFQFWVKPTWPSPPARDRAIVETKYYRLRAKATGSFELDYSWKKDGPPPTEGDETTAVGLLSGAAPAWSHVALVHESGSPGAKLTVYGDGTPLGVFPPEADRYLIALRSPPGTATVFGGVQAGAGTVGQARDENLGATIDRVRLTPSVVSFGAAPARFEAVGTWTRTCNEVAAGERVGTVHADVRGAGGSLKVEASADGGATWAVVRPEDGSDPPAPQDFPATTAAGAFRVRATLSAPPDGRATPFLRAVRLTILREPETILSYEVPSGAPGANFAPLASVSVSATGGCYDGTCPAPSGANDGSSSGPGEFWSGASFSSAGWVELDFPKAYAMSRIRVFSQFWPAEIYGSDTWIDFSISVSPDGISWTVVRPATPGTNKLGASGWAREEATFASQPVRAIRVDITNSTGPPGHVWRTAIREIEAGASDLPLHSWGQ